MNKDLSPIEPATTALLVVDLQERLLPAMQGVEACLTASRKMIEAAGVLSVPVLATEQYPAGLGTTCPSIKNLLGQTKPIEKVKFSACVEQVVQQLNEFKRPNVIVIGIEAHVCVQQTVLDLLRLGYTSYVCADAITSRRELDCHIALDRMQHAGAIVTTTESIIYELLGQAGTEAFKKILKVVK